MPDEKIPGTDAAWDSGLLGNDEAHAIPLNPEQQAAADAAVAEALLPLARLLAGSLHLEKAPGFLDEPAPSASWNDIPTLQLDAED